MKQRVNMQVSPLFLKKIKEIKGRCILKGLDKSLTDITEEIANMGLIDDIDIDKIVIKMDKRRRFF